MSRFTDATELAAMIERKEISALEAVDAAIARAEAVQPELNILVTDTFEAARDRAANQHDLTGPFAGVPYLVKDMYDVKGVPTRWGARFGPFLPPAEANSPQVDAMEAAGLVIIGKSALSEIGYLPTTEPLISGPTRNPWDVSRTPGGSSGGAAAAVAAGVVPMADAADGGGSIRIPASACGLFGLKPSRDRLVGHQEPSAGLLLTTEHCVSRTVRDSAGLFAAMERMGDEAVLPPVGRVVGPTSRQLRVGYMLESLGGAEPDPEVASALDATATLLENLGHRVEPTKVPFDTQAFFADFVNVWMASALQVVAVVRAAVGAEPNEMVLEPFTLAMAAVARALPDGEVEQSVANIAGTAGTYESWFADHDVILSPVLGQLPVPIGHITGDTPLDTLIERLGEFSNYTPLHNAVGAPAMSVPLAWSTDGLPIGSHFAARVGDERTLFELAYQLEEAQPWAERRPPVFAA